MGGSGCVLHMLRRMGMEKSFGRLEGGRVSDCLVNHLVETTPTPINKCCYK